MSLGAGRCCVLRCCRVASAAARSKRRDRRHLMKLTAIVAMAVATFAVTLIAAKGVPSKVTYIPHDTVNSTMAKGGQIIGENGLIVLAQRRGAGEVEVHENTNHVFIIVEGEATFVTGGTLVSAKNTAPGQIRAASVEGGKAYHL